MAMKWLFVVMGFAIGLVAVSGCERKDISELPELGQLPPIDVSPAIWSVSRRARMLHDDAEKALAAKDCKNASALAIEACTLDPSLGLARLAAAKVYASCGAPKTAVALLKQLVDRQEDCGGCVEALAAGLSDKALADVWRSEAGQALKRTIGDEKALALPTRQWATRIAEDLKLGKSEAFLQLIHPGEPWKLLRSCPRCIDESRRAPEEREFFGVVIAAKLAMRFTPGGKAFGAIPLKAGGDPVCAGRCCEWQVPKPVPVGEAALRVVCLRPVTRKQGALTRLEVIYGRPVDDERTLNEQRAKDAQKAEKSGQPRRRTIYLQPTR